MAPKRKRTEDARADAPAPRATRASSRLQGSNEPASASDKKAKNTVKSQGDGGVASEPVAKKAKRNTAKASAAKASKSKAQNVESSASPNEATSGRCELRILPTPTPFLMRIPSLLCCLRNTQHGLDEYSNGVIAPANQPTTKGPSKPQPYSEQHARNLFKEYEDKDAPGEIGPEGFEKLCGDMEISLEGALPLVLAWQMHATEMAKFKESEWMQATAELRASDLQTLSLVLHDFEDLLLLDKPPIQTGEGGAAARKKGASAANNSEPYNRTKYYQCAANKNKGFGELYAFCFALAKPPTARNIDMDTASAFWSVLVAPRYPIMKDILDFINEKGTYKGVNKDLWNMVLEFARTVKPDLSNFEPDGAWPSMLDDFVAWKKPEGTAATADINGTLDE